MLLSDRKFEICFYHILKQFMEGRNLVCGGAQLMLLSDRKFEICFYHILKQFMEGSILFSGFRLRFLRWWGSVSVIVGQDVFVCEYKVALVESR